MNGPARAAHRLAVGWLARLSWFLPPLLSPDYGPEIARTIRQARRYTMTTPRRIAALIAYTARIGVKARAAD